MGVPKFFKYISERYPCLSEVVREYQIPEFDNMYLDMNGIIHMCSHPDDNNPHFRITEERIFQDIFHYIEVLFRMIRPRKLFFMAIDGVAPRAKMNQQRGRRFRSAKDAEKQEAEAKKKGEKLPTEARFDSNCITPGTVFMARLHEQLKYFCTDKISNEPLWRNVKIILSGHETPGEGEHKIMDYIRYLRAQPGYDPNTRHCLYGLDADLIMLGLCTHEPHFSLLREEVKFGRKSTKRQSVPEEITFYLLHLSLMREYLELEFAPVKDNLVGFEYDVEKIIDDWVLMGFLVGNDFIPHLPHLHITNGALPILYKAYMEVLPTLDGYINEGGTLNLARFEKFMKKLTYFDVETFEEIRDDLTYMERKTGRKIAAHTKVSTLRDLEEWLVDSEEPKSPRDSDLAALLQSADDFDSESDEDDGDDEEDKAFKNYKKEYYMNKLEYNHVTPEVLRDQAEGYVRAIQWNLNYYYNGVCSWSWYYPHHYAPYISDIKGFADLKLEFDLETPFKPYEQLLAVLPSASKVLLPEPYHHLMTAEDSLISQYYPEEFQTDKNGKRQEWEAVVLIPFLDEKLLLEAMKPCNDKLTPEEKQRNTHGPMSVYTYSSKNFGKYEAPDYFPPVKQNYCKAEPVHIETIRVPKEKLVKGAYPGVAMDVYYPGFPTLKHLKYTAELKKAKVKVFEQPSRNDNMVIRIADDGRDEQDIPVKLLGTEVFVGWPHLVEGRVVSISNSKEKYISMGHSNQYNVEYVTNKGLFKAESSGIIERYKNRLGIEVGEVVILCHVQIMIGRKYEFSPNGRLTLAKQFSEMTAYYPVQTVVSNIKAYDSHHSLFRNVQDVFPEGSTCFTLCNPHYGALGIVLDYKDTHETGRVRICVSVRDEPNFEGVKLMKDDLLKNYKALDKAASYLGMSHFLYSRVTGTIYIETPDGEGGFKNVNAGLDLKFNTRNKETPGYTRKFGTRWFYTDKCTELIREYSDKFPEIFICLADHSGNENPKAEDVFKDDWEIRIKELTGWLRSVPTFAIEKQSCDSHSTETEVVREIERTVDEFSKNAVSKKAVLRIKPGFIYKHELQSGTLIPDPKVQVEMFDRIVNTRKGYSVPYGLKGTVIAISKSSTGNDIDTMYDIVFDETFKDGMQLNCSPERGYRLPKTAFINISYGKRVYEEKMGKETAKQENPWQNTSGQKFFNQFMNTAPPNRRMGTIPDQYPQKTGPGRPAQGSAFAPFAHNNPRAAYDGNARSETPERKEAKKSEGENKKSNGSALQPKPKREETKNSEDTPIITPEDFLREIPIEQLLPKEILKGQVDLRDPRRKKPSVDTDFLKNLLKIGNNSDTGNRPKNETPPSTPRREGNVSFEMLAQQVTKEPASLRLLTYYQSNGLGIPRYQYLESDKKFKAQITLTNGNLVISEPADTKEEATENVASNVLRLLMKQATTIDTFKSNANGSLPVPPKTWVEPKNVDREADQALKTALQNPFVPTQVMKRQVSKTNTSNSGECVVAQAVEDHESKEDKNTNKEKENKVSLPANDVPAPQWRPKRWRIAANFDKKN